MSYVLNSYLLTYLLINVVTWSKYCVYLAHDTL